MSYINKERDLVMCVLLSFFTLGLYIIYWFYKMTEEANSLSENETNCAGGGLALIYSVITFGIYLWYWSYKMGDRIGIGRRKKNMEAESNYGVLYMVLSIVQFDFIGFLLIQHELNKIARNGV